MKKVLGTLLLTGVFLLLLSALVVTPEDLQPRESVQIDPAQLQAVLAALPTAAPADAAQVTPVRAPMYKVLGRAETSATAALAAPRMRDANGHILMAQRYESCVYQLFRPEVAGG